jgi:hypothetical protein
MTNLRRWQIDSTSPYSLQIAADARLSQTDYQDDQTWEVKLGTGESPALALQTRYGGRAGLASIVPMWLHEGRVIYQTQAYAKPPIVTAFAPGYVRVEASLSPQLELQAEYWAMDSHAVGARLTVTNTNPAPTDIRLDLVGFIGMGAKEQKTKLLILANDQVVLGLGQVANLYPIIMLENSDISPDATSSSGKIGRNVTIEGQQKASFRWVHAALPDTRQSAALATKWLQADWDTAFEQIDTAAEAIPDIQTGNADWDATIAFSYQQLLQAFLRPAGNLPHASFVTTRQQAQAANDASNSAQRLTHVYLAALGVAPLQPAFAQGIIRNYLAVQLADGWIDWKPALTPQKQGSLCLPILARLAWGIFQYTEDADFLREVFPGLHKFFERWLQADLDKDGDGLPEWQNEAQTGYAFIPTFAAWQDWSQGADIRTVETPDLAAYLLSEAKSLREMAYFLRNDEAQQKIDERISSLQSALEGLWNESEKRYAYRDRDTHLTTTGSIIIQDARGGDELLPAEKLSPPNRLIVRITGGVNLKPKITLQLAGFNQDGAAVNEEVHSDQFLWGHGRGTYTSQTVFSQIDRITFEGLSRVYRIDVQTMDTTHLDINVLLPLWSAGIPTEHAADLFRLLTDPQYFWRPNGLTMSSAQDAHFDPTNANGSGGIWMFWSMLIGEGLIEYGNLPNAYELLKRSLNIQAAVLREQKTFSEFYHSDETKGLGTSGHIGGIVPLHLLMRVVGVRILNRAKAWVGGQFVWEQPVTVKQHGVVVQRTTAGTHIRFPSGYEIDIQGENWQEVIDPSATAATTITPFDDLEPEHD